MGKTVPSYRMALEDEISDWKRFANSLSSREDKEAFEQMMDAARNYTMAGGNATRPVVFEAMTMSILLYQHRRLEKIQKQIDSIKKEKTVAESQANNPEQFSFGPRADLAQSKNPD